MKSSFLSLAILLLLSTFSAAAGITTYTFTAPDWQSQVGSTACDGNSDGWLSDKPASDYSAGRTDAQGRLYGCGVSVKTGSSEAGATSVLTFEEVRQITFNFCQNSSKGQGIIHVQVGDNEPHHLTIAKPANSGEGTYNRDSVMRFTTSESGKIRFWITCTENAVNLNTITVRSKSGGANPFTFDTYQLVTDASQLSDSDQIIIGVHQPGINRVMGYFDETVSRNNIHAIAGKYTSDRSQIAPDDRAIYTLRRAELNGNPAFYIQDELRYEEAYLVASGGKTKNTLAVWNRLTDAKTYGNYGYWDITVAADGRATLMNLGNSLGRYLQYNATHDLFGCYADAGSQTPVSIYRCVPALGDTAAIVAPLANFGTVCMQGNHISGAKTLTVNANGLSHDIMVSLKHGAPFSLSTTQMDRDGDQLTITYDATLAGNYCDTLLLRAGDITAEAIVLLQVVKPLKVADAVHAADYATVYLDTVVVTKKYDTYIFVRDATGSMLIYDSGTADGKRYGSGLENGHVLTGVIGRFWNYYGVPELSPVSSWHVEKDKVTCLPESFSDFAPDGAPVSVDFAWVCRYVRFADAVIDDSNMASSAALAPILVEDAFHTGLTIGQPATLDAIVMRSHDVMQLWCVRQAVHTDLTTTLSVSENMPHKYLQGGQLLIRQGGRTYNANGIIIK